MLKKYKNQLYSLVEESNVNPLKFLVTEETIHNDVSRTLFTFDNSKLRFALDESPTSFDLFQIIYTTYRKGFPAATPSGSYKTFEFVKTTMKHWINNEVKNYIAEAEEVDSWTTLGQITDSPTLVINSHSNDQHLDSREKQQIVLALENTKTQIKEQKKLSEANMITLNTRLDYLIAAVDRIENRTDWKSLVLGMVGSAIINMGIDVETGRLIWKTLQDNFNLLFLGTGH